MADQKRWFKVWTSLAVDLDHESNDVIGAWTRLGCRTALVGTSGAVTFTGWDHLARFWNVTVERAKELAHALPSVLIEEGKTRHDALSVTFKNWKKYQEDSTQAERQKASRSKRRGEEIRRDKTRLSPLHTESPSVEWPESVADVRTRLLAIEAPPTLLDPEFWVRIHEWLGPDDSGVAYLVELDKYLAWISGLPKGQQRRDHRRGFRNWLSKAERWAIQERQRHAQGQTQAKFRR